MTELYDLLNKWDSFVDVVPDLVCATLKNALFKLLHKVAVGYSNIYTIWNEHVLLYMAEYAAHTHTHTHYLYTSFSRGSSNTPSQGGLAARPGT